MSGSVNRTYHTIKQFPVSLYDVILLSKNFVKLKFVITDGYLLIPWQHFTQIFGFGRQNLAIGNAYFNNRITCLVTVTCCDVSSQYVSVINQLDAQKFCFTRSLFHASTCHTYRFYDTRGCIIQFWPPDDDHMCSKHVEAWNKLLVKQNFCASSWLITETKKNTCWFNTASSRNLSRNCWLLKGSGISWTAAHCAQTWRKTVVLTLLHVWQ